MFFFMWFFFNELIMVGYYWGFIKVNLYLIFGYNEGYMLKY